MTRTWVQIYGIWAPTMKAINDTLRAFRKHLLIECTVKYMSIDSFYL